jgi:diaminopimelate epimerase
MKFVKMEGLGNDFIVIEGPTDPYPQEIASWCDRRRGIGADGVLEVTRKSGDRVGMRYWNADGGIAEMCGNGLRCVARYAYDHDWTDGASFIVDTAVGANQVTVNADGSVRAFLGVPASGNEVEVSGLTVHTVDIGNPHAIAWVADPNEAEVRKLGSQIEAAAVFPNGTNVEFATISGPNRIDLRVWERGVGETLACGTGAAATAHLAHEQGYVGTSVSMRLRGGLLQVELDDAGAWIEGPANTVFAGEI